jgi:hypothetical protein
MKRVDRARFHGSNSAEKYTPIVVIGVNRGGAESGFFPAIIASPNVDGMDSLHARLLMN